MVCSHLYSARILLLVGLGLGIVSVFLMILIVLLPKSLAKSIVRIILSIVLLISVTTYVSSMGLVSTSRTFLNSYSPVYNYYGLSIDYGTSFFLHMVAAILMTLVGIIYICFTIYSHNAEKGIVGDANNNNNNNNAEGMNAPFLSAYQHPAVQLVDVQRAQAAQQMQPMQPSYQSYSSPSHPQHNIQPVVYNPQYPYQYQHPQQPPTIHYPPSNVVYYNTMYSQPQPPVQTQPPTQTQLASPKSYQEQETK
jgi:hypothetical protein